MCLSKNISIFSRPLHWIPFLKITNTKTSRLPFQRPVAEHVTSKDIIVWPPHLRTPRTGSSFSIRRTCSARNYKFKPFETVRMDYRCFFGGGRCEIKHPNGLASEWKRYTRRLTRTWTVSRDGIGHEASRGGRKSLLWHSPPFCFAPPRYVLLISINDLQVIASTRCSHHEPPLFPCFWRE